MKMLKSITTMAAVMVFGITTLATAVFAASWEKGNYGSDLYGLPHGAQVHTEKMASQLDFGSDGYGLPHAAKVHGAKMGWDKIDFGSDIYGLPHGDKFHVMKK